jgi:hypothetical protein
MTDFIHQQYIEDVSLCDRIIAFHQMNPYKFQGQMGDGVNLSAKKSTDLQLNSNGSLYCEYLAQIKPITDAYINKFEYCNTTGNAWSITGDTNIQHYQPSEAFYAWHCERGLSKAPNSTRHLVFMTYLNDVNDEGETEFFYQKVKIKPRKGLTVIWPVDWTHTHRGIPSKTEEKYIITGWYNFVEQKSNAQPFK